MQKIKYDTVNVEDSKDFNVFSSKEFGKLFRDARELAGLSQETIAAGLHVDRSQVSRLETGDIVNLQACSFIASKDGYEFLLGLGLDMKRIIITDDPRILHLFGGKS